MKQKLLKTSIKETKLTTLCAFSLMLGSFYTAKSQQTTTQTFNYTGNVQTFTVPTCVSQITVDLSGSQGQAYNSQGGQGGRLVAVYPVTQGQVLNIYVGGQPYNGGGAKGSLAGVGGGASDIRIGGTALTDRVLVAGGGGGAGYNCGYSGVGERGGNGGGLTGETGWQCNSQTGGYEGQGGSQTIGGAMGNNQGQGCGQNGSLGLGGNGACNYGGGGGGGYYGGGGGGYGGGGGGSSYANANATSVVHTQGYRTGMGIVTIFYVEGVGNDLLVQASNNFTACSENANTTLTAFGGITSYTWSTGQVAPSIVVTPTANTIYSVAATSTLNCPFGSINYFQVYVNPTPTLNLTDANNGFVCYGNTVLLSVSGANSYYWWNTGTEYTTLSDIPGSTTVYTVTGTSLGCDKTEFIPIQVYPTLINVSPNTSVCKGSTVTIAASGANSYTWSTLASGVISNNAAVNVSPNSVPVTYSVAGDTGGDCVGRGTVQVAVNPTTAISVVSVNNPLCVGETAGLIVSGSTTGYTWTPNVLGNSIAPNTTTSYTVSGANKFGCVSSVVFTQNVDLCQNIKENVGTKGLTSVFPNPNNGEFSIVSNSNEAIQLNIIDGLGKTVQSINLSAENNYTASVSSSLSSGIYFIVGKSNTQQVYQKLIITK